MQDTSDVHPISLFSQKVLDLKNETCFETPTMSDYLSLLREEIVYKKTIQENMLLAMQVMKEQKSSELMDYYRSFGISFLFASLFTFTFDQIVFFRYILLQFFISLNELLTTACPISSQSFFFISVFCENVVPLLKTHLSNITIISSAMNVGMLLCVFSVLFSCFFILFRIMDHHISWMGFSISKPYTAIISK